MTRHRVLIAAPSRRTRGGITAVVNAHSRGAQWDRYGCRWFETQVDSRPLASIACLIKGWCSYIWHLPQCDLVHVHASSPRSMTRKALFLLPAFWLGKKTIIHLHSAYTDLFAKEKDRKLYRSMMRRADRVVVLSPFWEDLVKSEIGADIRTTVICNPCQPVVPDSTPKRRSILYAGTLIPRKGYKDLLEAFAALAGEFQGWHLTFAGNGETDKALETAQRLGIEAQVELLGWVSGEAKDKAFREASVFCLPSYAEGFSMAVLDAWAYGLPVISTKVGGLERLTRDGEDLLLFEAGDRQALTDALRRMMSDDALRERLSQRSGELAADEFNIDTINRRIGSLYEELIGR